jgi:inorganic phosphate transporter, PiT family
LSTWWFRLPISSSHCLIGSLFGAGLAASGVNGVAWHELNKVFIALLVSPILGFVAGALITWLSIKSSGKNNLHLAPGTRITHSRLNPHPVMRWLHVSACSLVAFSHGSNDGQKTMGIITLILATHFSGYNLNVVPFWVVLACAVAIGLGTTIGGWRIIKTVGTKISKQPITHAQGFGASMATAIIILVASHIGAPISTTHTLNSAVAGGTLPTYGVNKLNRKTVQSIVIAWLLTVPAAATIAAICYNAIRLVL